MLLLLAIVFVSFGLRTVANENHSYRYVYQSDRAHFWSFLGCYGADFAISDNLFVRGSGTKVGSGDIGLFRGSLYDCTLWAASLNFDTIGMFNNGNCFGVLRQKGAQQQLSSDTDTLSSSPSSSPSLLSGTVLADPLGAGIAIELGGGTDTAWMPCIFGLMIEEDDILDSLSDSNSSIVSGEGSHIISEISGRSNNNMINTSIKNGVELSVYNSSFEKLLAAIYSFKARQQLFDQFYNSDGFDSICIASFSIEFIESPQLHPFCPKISDLKPEYLEQSTLGYRTSIIDFYQYEETWNSSSYVEWTESTLETYYQKNYCFGTFACSYCSLNCKSLFEKYSDSLTDKIGVVIGSSSPWLESSIIEAGIGHIFTVEYRHILSKIPNLTALLPKQLASMMRSNAWMPVDVAFSFSSVEHSGLGRYGDPLHSQGDFLAINQIMCLLKPGGLFFLTVPVGADILVFNAHRIYGRHRLPLLLNGWELVDVIGDFSFDQETLRSDSYTEPILVLRKPL